MITVWSCSTATSFIAIGGVVACRRPTGGAQIDACGIERSGVGSEGDWGASAGRRLVGYVRRSPQWG